MKSFYRELGKAYKATARVMEDQCEVITSDYIQNFLSEIDTPVSLGVWLRFSYGEHKQLAEFTVHPSDYSDGALFGKDLAAASLLRKSVFLKTGIDQYAAAQVKFIDAELQCWTANNRLRAKLLNLTTIPHEHYISVAARKISQLLGDFSTEEWLECSGFGPGATTLIKRRDAVYSTKFSSNGEITHKLRGVLTDELFSKAFPLWADTRCQLGNSRVVQDSNVVDYVPKDATTHRTIAIEPSENMYFQKGIGSMIRSRLKKVGIDLNDQTTNQWYAREGSITGEWTTADLKMASDTVNRAIVEELIPHGWFRMLDLLRCQSGYDKREKKTIFYEKFSSMGNGYTFELESLIFWALGSAVSEGNKVLVYGDDVIIKTVYFPKFVQLLSYCGFTINQRKTHSEGYYRESCGAHYWNGRSVTPIFLKERIDHVAKAYKAANAVRELAERIFPHSGFRRTWRHLYHAVPQSLRLCVPAGVGDCGFVVPLDLALARSKRIGGGLPVGRHKHGFDGYVYIGLRQVPRKVETEDRGLLLARLRYPSRQAALRNAESPKGLTTWRFLHHHVPFWYETEFEAALQRMRMEIGLSRLFQESDEILDRLQTVQSYIDDEA